MHGAALLPPLKRTLKTLSLYCEKNIGRGHCINVRARYVFAQPTYQRKLLLVDNTITAISAADNFIVAVPPRNAFAPKPIIRRGTAQQNQIAMNGLPGRRHAVGKDSVGLKKFLPARRSGVKLRLN
jgi:hypothetical protein